MVFGEAIRRIFIIDEESSKCKTNIRRVLITSDSPTEDVRRKWSLYQSPHKCPHVSFRGGNDAEAAFEAWFAAFYDENVNDCNNNAATTKLAVISIRLEKLNAPKIVTLAENICLTTDTTPFDNVSHLIIHAQGGKKLYCFNLKSQPDTFYFVYNLCDRQPTTNVKLLKTMCESFVLKSALEKRRKVRNDKEKNFIKTVPEYLRETFLRLSNFML